MIGEDDDVPSPLRRLDIYHIAAGDRRPCRNTCLLMCGKRGFGSLGYGPSAFSVGPIIKVSRIARDRAEREFSLLAVWIEDRFPVRPKQDPLDGRNEAGDLVVNGDDQRATRGARVSCGVGAVPQRCRPRASYVQA